VREIVHDRAVRSIVATASNGKNAEAIPLLFQPADLSIELAEASQDDAADVAAPPTGVPPQRKELLYVCLRRAPAPSS